MLGLGAFRTGRLKGLNFIFLKLQLPLTPLYHKVHKPTIVSEEQRSFQISNIRLHSCFHLAGRYCSFPAYQKKKKAPQVCPPTPSYISLNYTNKSSFISNLASPTWKNYIAIYSYSNHVPASWPNFAPQKNLSLERLLKQNSFSLSVAISWKTPNKTTQNTNHVFGVDRVIQIKILNRYIDQLAEWHFLA